MDEVTEYTRFLEIVHAKTFLEHCSFPSKLDGVRTQKIQLEETEIPFVGITGLGKLQERKGKSSVWIYGEMISSNFMRNNGCAAATHIEGLITDEGELRFLESVYDFPACEGDCFEYKLKAETRHTDRSPLNFSGELIARSHRKNFEPVQAGRVNLTLNPFWGLDKIGKSISNTRPYFSQHPISGVYIPQFFNTFLGEIEEHGYNHIYSPRTNKLKQERDEKQGFLGREVLVTRNPENDGSIPF